MTSTLPKRRFRFSLRTLLNVVVPLCAAMDWVGMRMRQAESLRQAELTTDAKPAADLSWKVYEAGRLDDARLGWALRLWNLADEASRVIQACEQLLREGQYLPRVARED